MDEARWPTSVFEVRRVVRNTVARFARNAADVVEGEHAEAGGCEHCHDDGKCPVATRMRVELHAIANELGT